MAEAKQDTVDNTANDDVRVKARESARKRLDARGPLQTSDRDEASVGWTVQQGAAPADPATAPGAVFTPDELPDPEVQKSAGIDPVQQNALLIVASSNKERDEVRAGKKDAGEVKRGSEAIVAKEKRTH